jgi:hypothetical protein
MQAEVWRPYEFATPQILGKKANLRTWSQNSASGATSVSSQEQNWHQLSNWVLSGDEYGGSFRKHRVTDQNSLAADFGEAWQKTWLSRIFDNHRQIPRHAECGLVEERWRRESTQKVLVSKDVLSRVSSRLETQRFSSTGFGQIPEEFNRIRHVKS